eukprot:747682-Hanusia_phi.AAC.2
MEEVDNNPPELPAEAPIMAGVLDPDYEVRDREYTEKLLEKVSAHVAQAYRSARARAGKSRWTMVPCRVPDVASERFNIPFSEPRLDVILTKTEFRKYMSATAGRNPLAAEAAPVSVEYGDEVADDAKVAGIDTLTDEEKARQKARAERSVRSLRPRPSHPLTGPLPLVLPPILFLTGRISPFSTTTFPRALSLMIYN